MDFTMSTLTGNIKGTDRNKQTKNKSHVLTLKRTA